MKIDELLSVKTIPKELSGSAFHQIESGMIHTPYRDEIRMMSCVKEGNTQKLLDEVKSNLQNGVFMGEMSENSIMQYRYAAVSTVTIAVRYAIQGGLDESAAYGFSDEFIRKIDKIDNSGEIVTEIAKMMLTLTSLVNEKKSKIIYSPRVRKCISVINKRIGQKITVKSIAEEMGISADYLSNIFKKETGASLSSYITGCKLELAKTLIWEGYDNSKIARSLSFCSASHFVSLFKKEYGQTPGEYLEEIR